MNKFFNNDNQKVESFEKNDNNQSIFFGSKKDEIPYQPENVEQIKSGEMARYVEEPKQEDKRKYSQPAKYVDPSEAKQVVYEKTTPQDLNKFNQQNQITTQGEAQKNGFKNIFNKIFKK